MAVIIAVQMALTYVFTYHVGEVFSRISAAALFYFYTIKAAKAVRKSRAAAAAE